jgi:Na+-transporting NADH:ubiquinone oxidoreductase subunit C
MTETPIRSLLILLTVALICSVLVSVSAVMLRPIQLQNELIQRYRNIVALTGLVPVGEQLGDEDILSAVNDLDVRVVNLNTGRFEPDMDPELVNARAALNDPEASVAIPAGVDAARLGRRAVHEVVYLVWEADRLDRIILPISGQGMWSTLYGFLALEGDLNTIAAVTFYEQTETAGLGDQIQNPDWNARWIGRRLYGIGGDVRFRIASSMVDDNSAAAAHEVDGISGATVTADAVTALVRFWFAEEGFLPFITHLDSNPPVRSDPRRRES